MAELADAVAAIAAEAGALAMARWRADYARWDKADGSPVSEVDMAVDRLLHERLTALLPDAGWLSEETADNPARLACERVWIVDPIDGTRDFLRGRDGWCVSVALVERGAPVIAVLDVPARGEAWRAVAGQGATRGSLTLRVTPCAALEGARVPADVLPKAERGHRVAVAKPNSIALRIAMIAGDEADLVHTRKWGAEWDIAAAVLIAREAGAFVGDGSGAALAFNKPDPRVWGVLACVPGLRRAVLGDVLCT